MLNDSISLLHVQITLMGIYDRIRITLCMMFCRWRLDGNTFLSAATREQNRNLYLVCSLFPYN